MKVKFYGVRGSYPVPGKDTVKYGGNTTCVSITKERDGKIFRLILDSGTGIIQLGKDIVGNFFKNKEEMTIPILFTHLHPDHTQGFPFFAPNFFKNAKLLLYGMSALEMDIEKILSAQMIPPNFPIEYRSLKSSREHYEVSDGTMNLPLTKAFPFLVKTMQAYAPSHPQQGAVYYKITDTETGKSVACIWDNESKVGGDKAVVNFSKGCDVMIHDTQYTKEEYESDKMIVQGYGHSTYDMARENATQAGVKKLYCLHYNPSHTDEKLNEIKKNICFETSVQGIPCIFLAQEGLEIEI